MIALGYVDINIHSWAGKTGYKTLNTLASSSSKAHQTGWGGNCTCLSTWEFVVSHIYRCSKKYKRLYSNTAYTCECCSKIWSLFISVYNLPCLYTPTLRGRLDFKGWLSSSHQGGTCRCSIYTRICRFPCRSSKKYKRLYTQALPTWML